VATKKIKPRIHEWKK